MNLPGRSRVAGVRLYVLTERQAGAVEHAFSIQADAFEDQRFNRVFTADVEWLFERLALEPDHVVLDVAAGTGHAARHLAPAVRTVMALDVTVAMLEAGKVAAEQSGLRNVVFLHGDAVALPFLDCSFDVVVCRFAAHHFEDPRAQLGEMVRCLKRRGQLVVADLVANDDPVVARTQNQLERRRDPSHATLLSTAALRDALEALGVVASHVESREIVRPLAPWLAQTQASAAVMEQITAALRSEIDRGALTGFRPRDQDGELWFSQCFGSITAQRPG